MARSSMADLITRLRAMIGDPAGDPVVYSAWQDLHDYVVGDQRRPTVANGHFYRVAVAGTSASMEPTFPIDGGAVIDGSVVWEDQGAIPSGTATWTDDELEEFLDERRMDVSESVLRGIASTSGSRLVYLTFAAPRKWWESDAALTDAAGTVLTPADGGADPINGRWTFDDPVSVSVFVTGRYFDMYGTAQAVCEAWAARVAREFDFATDGQTFDRTGKREGLLKVAREYSRKAVQPGTRPGWHENW